MSTSLSPLLILSSKFAFYLGKWAWKETSSFHLLPHLLIHISDKLRQDSSSLCVWDHLAVCNYTILFPKGQTSISSEGLLSFIFWRSRPPNAQSFCLRSCHNLVGQSRKANHKHSEQLYGWWKAYGRIWDHKLGSRVLDCLELSFGHKLHFWVALLVTQVFRSLICPCSCSILFC